MIAIHHAIFIPESKVSASGVSGYGAGKLYGDSCSLMLWSNSPGTSWNREVVEHTDIQADSIWVDLCRNCRVARDVCKAFLEDYVIRSIINVPTLDSAEEKKEKQHVTTALTVRELCPEALPFSVISPSPVLLQSTIFPLQTRAKSQL